ncbi:MAG: hypothetical protein JWR26_2995 [Pedosphaera sp.]|nr:hypothetical protein [Pedosphaera sp.]
MKSFHIFPTCMRTSLALGFLVALTTAHGENTKPTKAPAATNSAPPEVSIPLSIFNLTNGVVKDPFFPLSIRQAVKSTNAAPAFSASSFVLKGLSGSSDRRLALINNRTLAAGEYAEITTSAGKIKIRCVEIRDSSVLIRTDAQSETIEVFLSKNAQ